MSIIIQKQSRPHLGFEIDYLFEIFIKMFQLQNINTNLLVLQTTYIMTFHKRFLKIPSKKFGILFSFF